MMQNPQILAALQERLDGLNGSPSGYMERWVIHLWFRFFKLVKILIPYHICQIVTPETWLFQENKSKHNFTGVLKKKQNANAVTLNSLYRNRKFFLLTPTLKDAKNVAYESSSSLLQGRVNFPLFSRSNQSTSLWLGCQVFDDCH